MLALVPTVVAEIPVEIEQNQILVPVRVGKSGTLNFLLDTGAEANVISADRVAVAGLAGGTASSGTAQGGEIDTKVYKGAQVRVGSLSLGRVNIAAVDLTGLSAGTGRHVDGILGYDFFRNRVIRIDYAARKVLVLRSGAALGPGIPLALAIRGRTPFVEARLLQKNRSVKGRLLLDTGAVGAINLYAQFLKLHPELRPVRSLALTAGAILPGQYVTRVGRLRRVTIGGLTITDAVANFSANANADDAAPGDAGLVGGYVLSRYTLTIDYARRSAVLLPTASSNRPFEFDASGLSLAAGDASFLSKKVRLVLPDSPAAEAGVKPGDLLLAIDGKPAADFTLAQLRLMLREIGVAHAITLQRGAARIDVRLTTRRLI